MSAVRRVARPMLASMFIAGGIDALRNPAPRVAAVAKLNLPEPETFAKANAATMLVGGVLLALGRFPRLASGALAASIVPTTAAGHRFWEEDEPASKANQRIHFLKNVGLLGGLLLAMVDTDGRESRVRQAKRLSRSAKREAKRAAAQTAHKAEHARLVAERALHVA